jgi:hypothetical protein
VIAPREAAIASAEPESDHSLGGVSRGSYIMTLLLGSPLAVASVDRQAGCHLPQSQIAIAVWSREGGFGDISQTGRVDHSQSRPERTAADRRRSSRSPRIKDARSGKADRELPGKGEVQSP